MLAVTVSKPKSESRERNMNVSPQSDHSAGSQRAGRSSWRLKRVAEGSVNNYLPFLLFQVEAAGEARLRMWPLTLKSLEDNWVHPLSSEKEAEMQGGI